MLEFLFILYLLLFFIFPLPSVCLMLGLGTTFFIYRRYCLWETQPKPGKQILHLSAITQVANFLASLALSFVMAAGVYIVIFPLMYLFLFNFLFCFLISLRWFDFTHRIYRHFIQKFSNQQTPSKPSDLRAFVTVFGLHSTKGFSLGLNEKFLDAGWLTLDKGELVFKGILITHPFRTNEIALVEKSSSDKIKITLAITPPPFYPEAYIISLKDQFYPFKSRKTRNLFYDHFQKLAITPPAQSPTNQGYREDNPPGTVDLDPSSV